MRPIEVWWTPVVADGGTTVLDPEERRRLAELRDDGVRARFATAHLLVRRVLGERLGLDPAEVPLRREPCPGCGGPHGRPHVPDWPVHFSASTRGAVAAVALDATPVGVDVEAPVSPETVRRVVGSLHPDEQRELVDHDPVRFARTWTRTEAYLKALGVGLTRDPAFDYLGEDPTRHPEGWTLQTRDLPDGHVLSVCHAGPRRRVELRGI